MKSETLPDEWEVRCEACGADYGNSFSHGIISPGTEGSQEQGAVITLYQCFSALVMYCNLGAT